MAYNNRTNWKDHVRDSDEYNVTDGSSGRKKIEPAGNVVQQGTPQSATNFNKLEEALQHLSNTYDLYFTTSQAKIRDLEEKNEALEKQVTALTAS